MKEHLSPMEKIVKWGLINGFEVLFLPLEPGHEYRTGKPWRCRITWRPDSSYRSTEITGMTIEEVFERIKYQARSIFSDLKMKESPWE